MIGLITPHIATAIALIVALGAVYVIVTNLVISLGPSWLYIPWFAWHLSAIAWVVHVRPVEMESKS